MLRENLIRFKLNFAFVNFPHKLNCLNFCCYFFFGLISIFFRTKFSYKISCSLRLQTYLISFLLDVNFDKSTIRLHLLLISSMLAKFQEN